jgi:lipoate-protein ligase A
MDARLIRDTAADGAWNMAMDEALARVVGETGVPVIRFYRWSEPTLSLGYFQSYGQRQSHQASQDCPVVRRNSGGGALLHHHELTYSLAIATGTYPREQSLYDILHGSLCQSLANQEICANQWGRPTDTTRESEFLCFRRRTSPDVVVGDWKILGSAQRKRRGVVLQHGSLLLATSACAPELLGISELAHPLDENALVIDWVDALKHSLNWTMVPSIADTGERELAQSIRNDRFLKREWTERRV